MVVVHFIELSNYDTSGNTLHLFGDTNATSNSYLKLDLNFNTSYNNPFMIKEIQQQIQTDTYILQNL
jgi:hypothetical protein